MVTVTSAANIHSAKIIQPALMSLMSLAVFELLWQHLAGCKNLKKC